MYDNDPGNLETFGKFLKLHQLQTLGSYVPVKFPDNTRWTL